VTTVSLAHPSERSRDAALLVALQQTASGPRVVPAPGLAGPDPAGLAGMAGVVGAKGERDEVVRAPGDGVGHEIVVFTGIGEEAPTDEVLRQAAGAATRRLEGIAALDVALPADTPATLRAVAEGLLLGAYRFDRYRTAPHPVQSLRILTDNPEGAAALHRARVVAEGVALARDLVNRAPSDLYPESFAALAVDVCGAAGVAVTVRDERDLEREGFGGLLAVGRGSARPPRLLRLEFRPPEWQTHVALVGKGITFDSGGLSLKPAKDMGDMKSDMAGAAAVLAAVLAAARLDLPIAVTGWLALAENMPSGSATRPSDVITVRGGRTVEVLNTDAEGRLVLADALVAAAGEEPDHLIDIATLTGAQMIALGDRVGAVMGHEDLRSEVVAAGASAGEQFWPMPLPAELADSLKTPVADIANMGERHGGMLVAGLFLQSFIPGRRWAHLDVAGPAYNTRQPWGYTPKGGTGHGVRTLVRLLEDFSERSAQN